MPFGLTLCCSCSSSSTTRFMCSSSSPSSAACWGARAVEEALPRTAGPPGARLRLLLLPPDSRSWFISKSQLATSWTFARLSEEEKVLTFCNIRKKDKTHNTLTVFSSLHYKLRQILYNIRHTNTGIIAFLPAKRKSE